MRKYETFFILDPDLSEEVGTLAGDKLKSVVNGNGGTVLSYVPWGKKKLAYAVKKRTQGLYVLMEYAGGPELVAELERNMRLDERVLKFITVKLEDRFDPEKEAARRAAALPSLEEEEAGEGPEGETRDEAVSMADETDTEAEASETEEPGV
jgi:small subunit ribosomal protein S6